jgi:methyl-accepting chemotaxis protein
MDKVTQQSASNAEEMASSSEELSAQANQLNALVGELSKMVGYSSDAVQMTTPSSFTMPKQTLSANSERRSISPRQSQGLSSTAPSKVLPLGDDEFEDF